MNYPEEILEYYKELEKKKAIDLIERRIKPFEWIPVSEGLPNTSHEVNITWVNKYERDYPYTASAQYHNGKWFWTNTGEVFSSIAEVIAWAYIPEPYKPTEKDRKEGEGDFEITTIFYED